MNTQLENLLHQIFDYTEADEAQVYFEMRIYLRIKVCKYSL